MNKGADSENDKIQLENTAALKPAKEKIVAAKLAAEKVFNALNSQ